MLHVAREASLYEGWNDVSVVRGQLIIKLLELLKYCC